MTPRSVGIHDGIFHADEVTACALLILFDLVDAKLIVRTRDPSVIDECEFVCDVGGIYNPEEKRFDHHQASYDGPLSSAGMIIHYLYNQKIIPSDEFEFLYNNFIKGVDEHDNGKSPQVKGHALFSHIVANFNPVVYDAGPEKLNEAFHQALSFVRGHIERLLGRYRYNKECRKIVAKAMQEGTDVLYFDRAVPWLESFFALDGKEHPAKFVVMPAGEHWKLRGIPPDDEHKMEVRVPLPKDWAGLLGDELKEVSGIEGAIFCHKGRFTSVWENKESAIKALEKVMEMSK
jgi:uncharacterized UPF0160 family protein